MAKKKKERYPHMSCGLKTSVKFKGPRFYIAVHTSKDESTQVWLSRKKMVGFAYSILHVLHDSKLGGRT